MQKRPINILIACGNGIATSTLAASTVEEICKEKGIAYNIKKTNMNEVTNQAEYADVVLTTSKCRRELACPLMSVTPFVTGIGEDTCKKNLAEFLEKAIETL